MSRHRRPTVDKASGNIQFRSGFEKTLAKQLTDAGIEFEFEKEVVLYIEPAKTRKYNPDFKLTHNGIIIEAKGIWDLDDRKKIVMVREQNPNLDVRMVFQRDHPINRGAKTRYSTWCEKRGIPYAVGKIPDSWLKQKRGKTKT